MKITKHESPHNNKHDDFIEFFSSLNMSYI